MPYRLYAVRCWMHWRCFSIRPVPTVRSGSPSRRYCWRSGAPAGPGVAIGFVLAMALALGLYMLAGHCALKPLFARPRPCDLRPEMLTLVARPHGWSFPSGHTSSAFAAAFALWLQNRRLGAPALALAGFIGFTRMYLYVHFPTDILGGVALGLALGACGSLLADKISNRWAKRSEVKRTV